MKKVFYAVFVAIFCLAFNTSCIKEDVFESPELSKLKSFDFFDFSDEINITYSGINPDTDQHSWYLSLGKNYEGYTCLLDPEKTTYQIEYVKGKNDKATFSYTINYTYINTIDFTEHEKTTTGNLDLTFTGYDDWGLKYKGVATGTKDGNNVKDMNFTISLL